MARRVTLPSADDLFRASQDTSRPADSAAVVRVVPDRRDAIPERPVTASGRIRHDEKVTVYVTADELLAIEQARLTLRRDHGLAVDRGRLVREAIHLALDSLETESDDSDLVRRLADPA